MRAFWIVGIVSAALNAFVMGAQVLSGAQADWPVWMWAFFGAASSMVWCVEELLKLRRRPISDRMSVGE